MQTKTLDQRFEEFVDFLTNVLNLPIGNSKEEVIKMVKTNLQGLGIFDFEAMRIRRQRLRLLKDISVVLRSIESPERVVFAKSEAVYMVGLMVGRFTTPEIYELLLRSEPSTSTENVTCDSVDTNPINEIKE